MSIWSEHTAQFLELSVLGELHAINSHDENLDAGPWLLGSDIRDSATADRLKARFRSAVQKAAMAAGAPYRVNRLDWWVGKLAHGKPLPIIQDLIQRSAEYCEELETRALELGPATSSKPEGGGLYRDRYPCDWGEHYSLYDELSQSFSDVKAEFEYWTEHIWRGVKEAVTDLDKVYSPRKRKAKDTPAPQRNGIGRRATSLDAAVTILIRGLSYDLAVLRANYIIDRGLRGDGAVRTFQDESLTLIETVTRFELESLERFGLSNSRRENAGMDVAKPFREVGEDLRHLTAATPTKSDPGSACLSDANAVTEGALVEARSTDPVTQPDGRLVQAAEGAGQSAHTPKPAPSGAKSDKGNLDILRGTNGEFKSTVTLDVAARFGGVSSRAIQMAARKGSLETMGSRVNRRILVPSLLKYYPSEK